MSFRTRYEEKSSALDKEFIFLNVERRRFLLAPRTPHLMLVRNDRLVLIIYPGNTGSSNNLSAILTAISEPLAQKAEKGFAHR
ncbi:hypothetical protein ABIB39_003454 [Mucilaginibacter sp. UYP27]